MHTRDFLAALFSDIVEAGLKLSIWTPNDGTFQFLDLEKAAQYGLSRSGDTYFGVGASSKEFSQKTRSRIGDIDAIPGFWIDIDIAGPHEAHKSAMLPVSEDDALDMLYAAMPLKPTILVNSGYGLHAYWIFKEPWIFENEHDVRSATIMAQSFVLSIKYHAALRGWKLDSVFDLTRIMRLPGSKNCKVSNNHIECVVKEFNQNYYNPDDFEKYFVNDADARSNESICNLLGKDKNPLQIVVSANATPPFEKFENLIGLEDRFAKSWNKERTDLKDQSLSSYELSIASFCVSYGWTDQEVANTLIRFRKKYADEKKFRKALRVDYLTRTILRAKKTSRTSETDDVACSLAAQADRSKQESDVAPPTKEEISATLETILKVRIVKIHKIATDDPRFEIILASGECIIAGNVEAIISQAKLRNLLAAHKGIIPRKVKSKIWDEYATLLLQLVEEIKPAYEATIKGALCESVRQYIEQIGTISQWESAYKLMRPFVRDGKTYIFTAGYASWSKMYAEKISSREMAAQLSAMGYACLEMQFSIGGDDSKQTSSRTVYDVTNIAKHVYKNENPGLVEYTDEAGMTEVVQ